MPGPFVTRGTYDRLVRRHAEDLREAKQAEARALVDGEDLVSQRDRLLRQVSSLTEANREFVSIVAASRSETQEARERALMAQEQADRLGLDMAQIRGSMYEVAVYEGLVDTSPVAMMVSELVRDHEELEARIDAAMLVVRDLNGQVDKNLKEAVDGIVEIGRLLQGGTRIPDFPEAIQG